MPGLPWIPKSDGLRLCTCVSDPGENPQLVYPPDQVLLPPNMNVIEAQFMPGDNNTLFEIDFENAITDVRLETQCSSITNTRGSPTGGC